MPIRKTHLRTPKPKAAPLPAPDQLAKLVARAHDQLVKLTRERDQAQRRLVRARIRYSVLTRLAADQAKRELVQP